jgi:NADPH:quinone reductase-like Zn-dependent oxidoreductase
MAGRDAAGVIEAAGDDAADLQPGISAQRGHGQARRVGGRRGGGRATGREKDGADPTRRCLGGGT